MSNQQETKTIFNPPKMNRVKFIERSNGIIKGYSVNTYQGLYKKYNQDRVSIVMNITKPNFQGRWPHCSYFGIFDGHGGTKCADFLKENIHKYITQNQYFPQQPIKALKYGFQKAQQQFLHTAEAQNPIQRSGSCALVVLIIDQMCYVANVGDSRAIISMNKGKKIYSISTDHKPNQKNQRQRIINAGGKIYQSSIKNKNGDIILGPFRIDPGKLSVSRSFGDIEAKDPKLMGNPKVLIAKPQITYFQINKNQHDFIILCTDGVYDKLSNEQVAECFWSQRQKPDIYDQKYDFIGVVPSKIIQKSMSKMSMDNLTSLVIVFEDNGELTLPKKLTVQQKQLKKRMRNNDTGQNKLQNFNSLGKMKPDNCKIKQQMKQKQIQNIRNGINKQNQINKQNSQTYNKQNKTYNIQKPLLRRKNSANLIQQKKIQTQSSLSNSISSKLLAGSKAFLKQKSKQSVQQKQKINMINQLMKKKKSIDVIKKQNKDALWKQMTNNFKNNQKNDKHIRF